MFFFVICFSIKSTFSVGTYGHTSEVQVFSTNYNASADNYVTTFVKLI